MSEPKTRFCPNLVARVSADLGLEGLSYWVEHGGSQTSNSHTECSETRCYANDDEGHVSTRHIKKSCSCQYIGPKMSDITRIINANRIPIIAVEGPENDSYIIIETYRPGLVFTAISHALGDCFRNPNENKLPTCQVRSIQRVIASLSSCKDPIPRRNWFWIDTLCVPSQHLRDPDTWRAVTNSMKLISQIATQTIVLDSDISLLTSQSEAREVFIRIAYSSWSSRFWTLQEAVYANRLLFHFSDQTIELEALMLTYGDGTPGWEQAWRFRFPYKELRRYLDNFSGYQVRSEDHYALLVKALEGRATSNIADKPLVIANLFGVDLSGIEKTKLYDLLRGYGFGGSLQ